MLCAFILRLGQQQLVGDPHQQRAADEQQARNLEQPDHHDRQRAANHDRADRAPHDGFGPEMRRQLARGECYYDCIVAGEHEVDDDDGQQCGEKLCGKQIH